MKAHPIDYKNWERREIFETFRSSCMYTTVQLDITRLLISIKAGGLRLYPTMVYCIANVINNSEDFRYCYNEDGQVSLWEHLDPMYTLPRSDKTHLFSIAVTAYTPDFKAFYQTFTQDYTRAQHCGRLFCDGKPPANVLGVTAMTGVHFSSFSFGDKDGKEDLTPFTILGKYQQENGRILLPVCGEFAHGVNDGYHISQFFSMLQSEIERLAEQLQNA